MKNLILTIVIFVLTMGLAVSVKAIDKFTYEPLTVVAGTASANKVLTKIFVGALGNTYQSSTIYISDQANTYAARTNVKMVLEVISDGLAILNMDGIVNKMIDTNNFINSSTRYGIWFDYGIRVEAVGNTPNITWFMRASSDGR